MKILVLPCPWAQMNNEAIRIIKKLKKFGMFTSFFTRKKENNKDLN